MPDLPPEAGDNPAARSLYALDRVCTQLGRLGIYKREEMILRCAALDLPDELRAAMLELGQDDPDQIDAVCKDLSRVFYQQIVAPDGAERASDSTKILLGNWAYRLGRRSSLPALTTTVLDSLDEQVRELLESVKAADDLSDSLRTFLITHLGEMLRAILEARVLGPQALSRILDSAQGGLIRLRMSGDLPHDFQEHPVIGGWWGVVAKVADVCGILAFAASLAVTAASGAGMLSSSPDTPAPAPPAIHAPAVPGPTAPVDVTSGRVITVTGDDTHQQQ